MAGCTVLARATLHDPSLLLLDEPFTGLDHAAGEALRRRIAAERDARRTIVCVTHDPAEVWDDATRVIVMVAGRVVHDAARAGSLAAFRGDYGALVAA